MTSMIARAARGELASYLEAQGKAAQAAAVSVTKEETTELKLALRSVVGAAFPKGGRKVANAIRQKDYTNPDGAAGLVYSKFGRKSLEGGFIDYLLPFTTGATIRPTRSKYLYIPLQKTKSGRVSKRNRGFRASVRLQKNLRFVRLTGNRFLIVRGTKTRSTPIALLIPRVKMPKRIDPGATFARTTKDFDQKFLRRFEELAQKAGSGRSGRR